MLLAPASRADGQWTVVDQTGKSVSAVDFTDRDTAIRWIVDNGHTAYDSQGDHAEPGEGKF